MTGIPFLAGLFSLAALAGTVPRAGQLPVRIVTDEAEAALAILETRRAGGVPDAKQWQALFASEGYRRLQAREAAIGRPFTDSAFAAFLETDSLAGRAPLLRKTVEDWKRADLQGSWDRVSRYLPAGTTVRGTVYLLIKPRPNSFVFEPATNPAIMLYVDPAVSRAKLENTIAHELHHLGYAQACASPPAAGNTPADRLIPWLGAFGEGLAMLAAAGGPDVHPHAVSDSAERARWDDDVRSIGTAFAELERFFFEVLDERMTSPDSIRAAAMAFFGVQGPWYTVGWLMAWTIDAVEGRDALVAVICRPAELLRAYDRAVRSEGVDPSLPRWSDSLLARLP